MREVRCPNCHRLQCKAVLNGQSAVEIRCRCKTMIYATGEETFVAGYAASPSAGFYGRLFDGGYAVV